MEKEEYESECREKAKENAKKILEEVDTFFSNESKWSKGAFARDKEGRKVTISSEDATSRCFFGAVRLVEDSLYTRDVDAREVVINTSNKLARRRGFRSGSVFNDAQSTTFAALKEFIKECKQEVDAYEFE